MACSGVTAGIARASQFTACRQHKKGSLLLHTFHIYRHTCLTWLSVTHNLIISLSSDCYSKSSLNFQIFLGAVLCSKSLKPLIPFSKWLMWRWFFIWPRDICTEFIQYSLEITWSTAWSINQLIASFAVWPPPISLTSLQWPLIFLCGLRRPLPTSLSGL